MLALIALRNLARNRRRTVLAVMVVAAGSAGLLVTAGFVRYSFDGLSEAIIHGGLGHIEVIPTADLAESVLPSERAGRPPGMDQWADVRATIEAQPHVRAAGAVIQFAGVATHEDRTASFVGAGNEPDRMRLMNVETRLRAGAGLPDTPPAQGADAAIVGVGLARALGVSPGDTMTVMVSTVDGSLNAVDVTVRGLFSTGLQELDARMLQVHLLSAQRALGTPQVTSLVVGVADDAQAASVEAALRTILGGRRQPLSVLGWEVRAPFYQQVRGLYLGIFVFLGTIVALLVVLSAANTLLMSMLERTREFGTLLAIGTSRRQLAALMMLEANWLALIGGAVGCAIAVAVSAGLDLLGIKMPPPPGAVDPVDLALMLRPGDFLWAMLVMVLILSVAAAPAILRLVRLRIVDALGHV